MAKGFMYINGRRVAFDGEKNVLDVIRKAGIDMPTFCYHSELSVYGACRMCVVEDERGKIDTSCSMEPKDGMRILTNTKRLLKHRRMILELLLSSHCRDCTVCEKNGDCHLQELARRFGIHTIRFDNSKSMYERDESSPSIVRDPNRCILCGDCIRMCEEMQGMGVLNFAYRGSELRVMPAFNRKLSETSCVSCGQCAAVCPTGAIFVKNEIGPAWAALHDPQKRVSVQIAPSVRVSIGEAFGMAPGSNVMNKLVTALKMIGADEVYDTNSGADLTVIEESTEFLERLEKGGPFPMFTSCCPAWIKYLENKHPEWFGNVSTCKSPMQMLAAILKYQERKNGPKDDRESFHIAVMPCTAKKMEAARDEFKDEAGRDVDLVLTVQELIMMIKESGLQFAQLDEEAPDTPYGYGSGSAVIFGTTGGVTEAVARHIVEDTSENTMKLIEYSGVRDSELVREIILPYKDREIRIAITHGLGNARKLLKKIAAGDVYYDLVEVMACKNGCVGGAGQPKGSTPVKQQRSVGLYDTDRKSIVKHSKLNPFVDAIYKDGVAENHHELLHVDYLHKK